MTGGGVPERRPLLPATFRGRASAWLWRRVKDEAKGAPAALAAIAGEQAAQELAYSLAELREAARQWEERTRSEVESSDVGTAEHFDSGSGARSAHELTTTEAAALLGVSDSIVRRRCRDGRLVARRPGGSWLIDRGSVLDLLDAQRSAAA